MNMVVQVSDSEGSQLSRSDDLLRRLRHDLSNHVNQIIGFSELVSEELADADPVASLFSTMMLSAIVTVFVFTVVVVPLTVKSPLTTSLLTVSCPPLESAVLS